MSRRPQESVEPDLHAYADGRLDAPARARVEAYLADNPAAAKAVEGWRRQNETLRALYGHAAAEPVPPRLDIRRMEEKTRIGAGRWLRMAAAAVLLLATGTVAGWYGRGIVTPMGPAETTLADEAMKAHRIYSGERVHPVEVWAGEKDHLQTWLSKRLARALTIPDLSTDGLTLVGGRLLPAANGPAAQVMYEDETGQRVTLYIVAMKDGGETDFRYIRLETFDAFAWTDETISCVLVGSLPRDRLLEIATSAYKQLE